MYLADLALLDTRAVLFDVYGTLAYISDPQRPYRKLLTSIRSQRPELTKEAGARSIMCQPLDLRAMADLFEFNLSSQEQHELELQLAAEIGSIQLFPEVAATLVELRERGYLVGVCSNLAQPYVAPIEELLRGMIDIAVWSCEVGAMKPDAEIYAAALTRFDVAASSVLMIGDSYLADVEGPRTQGIRSLHLNRAGRAPELTALDQLLSKLKGTG